MHIIIINNSHPKCHQSQMNSKKVLEAYLVSFFDYFSILLILHHTYKQIFLLKVLKKHSFYRTYNRVFLYFV